MEVNGNMIMDALQRADDDKNMANSTFRETLFAFPEEAKKDPAGKISELARAERRIADLQIVQEQYNFSLFVMINDRKITLADAVKRLGGASRVEKMWRIAAVETGRDRWNSIDRERNKDSVYSIRQITVERAKAGQKDARRLTGQLKTAIREANTTPVKFKEVNPELFA